MTRVFVYGSLLSGFHNHRLLDVAEFEGTAYTRGRYRMFNMGAYPGVTELAPPLRIEPRAGAHILGEVYRVDELTLARLDRLEGHPKFYERRIVELLDGTLAWMYLLPEGSLRKYPLVASLAGWEHGSWRRFVSEGRTL